jgi:hypothetical protein
MQEKASDGGVGSLTSIMALAISQPVCSRSR